MARDTFKNIAQPAEKVGTISSDVVKYRWASEPICGVSQVAAWKAYHRYAQAGRLRMKVSASDRSGYMQLTMRMIGKPGSPTVITNRASSRARWRSHMTGDQRRGVCRGALFALRTDPLRLMPEVSTGLEQQLHGPLPSERGGFV